MRAFLLLIPALLLLLGGVAALPADQAASKPNKDMATLVKGNNTFALDLYGRLRQKEGNLFFSPYSISDALAMTYGGARGPTAEQMAHILHFDLPEQQLHATFAELIGQLTGPGRKRAYQLSVANALWGQKGFVFLPDFIKLTRDSYAAGLKEVDFAGATEQARQTINGWVEKETNDKIKELLKSGILEPDTRLVLTNAIYFKSAWLSSFQEKATKDDKFKAGPGKEVPVRMMRQVGPCGYLESDTFQAVDLLYAGGELSMLIVLPKKVDGLAELERALSGDRLSGWLARLEPREVDVRLPRFKITSDFKLGATLKAMGMTLPFSGKADFSGMTTQEQLHIAEVIHKAYVDVNEKGTEAAAATAVIMRGLAYVPPVTVRVDHPFLVLIREHRTGSLLFLGRVSAPGA